MGPQTMTGLVVTGVAVVIIPLLILFYGILHQRRHPPTPAMIEAGRWVRDWRFPRSWLPAFVTTWIFNGIMLAFQLRAVPGWARIALVLTAVATFLWFLIHFFREYRSEDERTRRVQGDGCAFAVGFSIVSAIGMWAMNLWPERTHDANQSVLMMLPLGYWIGILVSKSRYSMRSSTPPGRFDTPAQPTAG
jgi:hypothetical protein